MHPISALHTDYSLWSREVEADILPAVRRLGIGFVAYSPLGRGFLSGAVRSRSDLKPGDWRLTNPRFSEEAIAKNSRLAERGGGHRAATDQLERLDSLIAEGVAGARY